MDLVKRVPTCPVCLEKDETVAFRPKWGERMCDVCVQVAEDVCEVDDWREYEEALYEEEDNDHPQ